MEECNPLVAGALLLLIAGACFWWAFRQRSRLRMAEQIPLSTCGSVAEGMVRVTGKAVGAATVHSPVLGLPALLSFAKVEVLSQSGNKKSWKTVCTETRSVPFYVEDQSGRVWLDPSGAELQLAKAVEYNTRKKWRPKPHQRRRMTELGFTSSLIGDRLHDFYESYVRHGTSQPIATAGDLVRSRIASASAKDPRAVEALNVFAERQTVQQQAVGQPPDAKAQRAAARARKRRHLRFSESLLLAGDTVYAFGPAYHDAQRSSPVAAARIHRVHPSDPFLIGDASPDEIHARVRKQAAWYMVGGGASIALAVVMMLYC